MKQYQVTLNFTFELHGCDIGDIDDEESLSEEDMAKLEAFQRTDRYFEKHSVIEHIKSNDALSFVEFIPDGEVLSAEWDKKKFAIHMVVDTDDSEDELRKSIEWNSLEDGEYEACGDTGWIVMTRGPKGEVFDSPWDTSKFWEYGLTDYRQNPIEICLLGERPEVPDVKELFSMTEKGKALYSQLAEARKEGLRLNQDDEKTFWMMRKLMNDHRLYPVGKAIKSSTE